MEPDDIPLQPSPEQWPRIEEVFELAQDKPSEEQQEIVRRECADDPEVAAFVLRYLAIDARGRRSGWRVPWTDGGLGRHTSRSKGAPWQPPLFETGDQLNQLEIRNVIGTGGFGRVYRAYDRKLHREVAVKVLRLARSGDRDRSLAEARNIARLQHPHVLTIHAVHDLEKANAVAIEMEYVEGGTLADLLAEPERRAMVDAVTLTRQITEALTAVHEHGVTHGDLKPANILLDGNGNVRLVDFGLSQVWGSKDEPPFQGIWGTPRYMAPECLDGRPASPASDVWSLGAVIFELYTGVPLRAPEASSVDLGDTVSSPYLQSLIASCCRHEPEQRPATARRVLERLLPERDVAREIRPSPIGRAVPWRQMRQWLEETPGKGTTVIVSGRAGIGKTFLTAHLVDEVKNRGGHALWIRCRPDRSFAECAAAPLRRESSISGRVSRALNDPQTQRGAMERAVRELSRSSTLVVVVEDAHFVEPSEGALLRHLADAATQAGSLFLLLTRDRSGTAELASGLSPEHVELGPLRRRAVLELLEIHTNAVSIEPDVADFIIQYADGTPETTIQLSRELSLRNAIRLHRSVLVPGPAWRDRVRIAASNLDASQLERMPPAQRDVLEVASVVGSRFDASTLAHALERDVKHVLRDLQPLVSGGILNSSSDGYEFAKELLREYLYASLSSEYKREFHASIAEELERQEQPPEVIGRHWIAAGESQRALPHLLAAAEAAKDRQDNVRAKKLFELAGFHDRRTDLEFVYRHGHAYVSYASVLADLEDMASARELFAVVARLAAERSDDPLLASTHTYRDRTLSSFMGAESIDVTQQKWASETLGSGRARGHAFYNLALVARHRGRYEEAERHWSRALQDYRVGRSPPGEAAIMNGLGRIFRSRGDVGKALRCFLRAAKICERAGWRLNAVISRINVALTAFRLGARAKTLRRRYRESQRLLRLEHGESRAIYVELLIGEVEEAEGKLDAAIDRVRRARHAMEQNGFGGKNDALLTEAHICTAMGALDDATRALGSLREEELHVGLRLKADIQQALCDIRRGAVDTGMRALQSMGGRIREDTSEFLVALCQAFRFGAPLMAAEHALTRRASTPARRLYATCWLHDRERAREARAQARHVLRERPTLVGALNRHIAMWIYIADLDVEPAHRWLQCRARIYGMT